MLRYMVFITFIFDSPFFRSYLKSIGSSKNFNLYLYSFNKISAEAEKPFSEKNFLFFFQAFLIGSSLKALKPEV